MSRTHQHRIEDLARAVSALQGRDVQSRIERDRLALVCRVLLEYADQRVISDLAQILNIPEVSEGAGAVIEALRL
jgi:hypothetical protein